MVLKKNLSDRIYELVKDTEVFDVDALKRMYPNGLYKLYNAIILPDRMVYNGLIKKVQNEEFGCLKFLGVFDSTKL